MSKNLYIGNLPFSATDESLRAVFEQFGTVSSVKVISDRMTGRSRGFGFIEMDEGGDAAIEAMNGKELEGRVLTVNEARPRADRPRGNGGGDGGRY
jgi:RNA recognition motif-containing protein